MLCQPQGSDQCLLCWYRFQPAYQKAWHIALNCCEITSLLLWLCCLICIKPFRTVTYIGWPCCSVADRIIWDIVMNAVHRLEAEVTEQRLVTKLSVWINHSMIRIGMMYLHALTNCLPFFPWSTSSKSSEITDCNDLFHDAINCAITFSVHCYGLLYSESITFSYSQPETFYLK